MFESEDPMDERYEDHPLDEAIRRLAGDYNDPPATPREAMWGRIRAARAAAASVPADAPAEPAAGTTTGPAVAPPADAAVVPLEAHRARREALRRRAGWAAGIAAVLALGIGIGRISKPDAAPNGAAVTGPVASAPRPDATGEPAVADQIAIAQHLGQSEAFLTLFRAASARAGAAPSDREGTRLAAATAGRLLTANRLLLDSPAAAADPAMQRLLQDLELVLAQIAQLQAVDRPAERRLEVELINEGLEGTDVMLRLRAARPAGDPDVTTTAQGVL